MFTRRFVGQRVELSPRHPIHRNPPPTAVTNWLNNSSAHAEVIALMMAQARVGRFTLNGNSLTRHELFSSCEPCAMCLGATLWSGVIRLAFAATREDAMRLSFDEGPVFPESYRYLTDRGVRIDAGLRRAEANAVFDDYVARGGPIYNR